MKQRKTTKGAESRRDTLATTQGSPSSVLLGSGCFTRNDALLATLVQACRGAVERELWPLRRARDSGALEALPFSVRALVGFLGQVCPALQSKGDGYCAAFLARKLTVGLLAETGTDIDWGVVSLARLRLVSADQSSCLDSFPEDWTAKEVSEFIFGRPDWGIFVSAYNCLWLEAAAGCRGPQALAKLLDAVASPAFASAVSLFAVGHGVSPHPTLAVRALDVSASP